MPRTTLTHEAGRYRVMTSKLLKLVSGIPGSTEKPAVYEEYEGPGVDERGNYREGEVVELSAEDASRHAQHTVPVFVSPTSNFDRRVRLVPAIIPVGKEEEVMARAPAPSGVAVVVPPEMTPEGAGQAPSAGQPGTEAGPEAPGPQVRPGAAVTRGRPAGTAASAPTGTPPEQ